MNPGKHQSIQSGFKRINLDVRIFQQPSFKLAWIRSANLANAMNPIFLKPELQQTVAEGSVQI